jgi:hypothetical protein
VNSEKNQNLMPICTNMMKFKLNVSNGRDLKNVFHQTS